MSYYCSISFAVTEWFVKNVGKHCFKYDVTDFQNTVKAACFSCRKLSGCRRSSSAELYGVVDIDADRRVLF